MTNSVHSAARQLFVTGAATRGLKELRAMADDTERKTSQTELCRSAQEALLSRDERYRAAFELAPLAIYSCDAKGVIQQFNHHASQLWGREPVLGDAGERFCGSFKLYRPDGSLMPHDQCPTAEVIFGKSQGVVAREVVIERPDRSRVAVVLNISLLQNDRGEVVGAINCFYEITERKQAENTLKQMDCRKDEFLAMLAHELRNPLAPIRNALQILRRAYSDQDAVRMATDTMQRQVGQMARLVDDLFDVGRISRGKIQLRTERTELASAIHPAIEAARALYMSMEHEFTLSLPPEPIFLNADPIRLAQVVGNLLNNACKFTEPGGRIWLTVDRAVDQAVIRVRDNGIGISADQVPHIFDMFSQANTSLQRPQAGLGIGLTLAKDLVELHGGTVEAYSAGLGQGSEFVVRLPILVDTPHSHLAEPVAGGPATSATRILVVDDNLDSAETLAMVLKLIGMETLTAYDGLRAVEAASTFRPDVALLDIGLPKLNGYDVCRRIREQPWGQGMIMIALSGWGQDEYRQLSKEAGFNAHMVKPIEISELRKLFSELLPAFVR